MPALRRRSSVARSDCPDSPASTARRSSACVSPGAWSINCSSAVRSWSARPSRAANHARSASTSVGEKRSAGRCAERAACLVDRIGGARPPEPGAPDDGIVGAPLQTGVQPPGRLGKPSPKQGEVGARQPDAVVVRRLARRLLDGGSNRINHHHRAVDQPQAAEVAGPVGRGVPPFLEEPAHLVEPALPVKKLVEQVAMLNRARAAVGPTAAARTASASANRPRSPTSVRARAIAAFRPSGDSSGTRAQALSGGLVASRRIFADAQQKGGLGVIGPPRRLRGEPPARRLEPLRVHIRLRLFQTGLESPLRDVSTTLPSPARASRQPAQNQKTQRGRIARFPRNDSPYVQRRG